MRRFAIIATILVLLRLAVSVLHGEAHERLQVGLAAWQWTYVYTVIVAAPLVAMVLYWTRWARQAALLLWTSMLAGMAFGIYHHFVAVSPDHVSYLPEGDARGLFISTAVLLVPVELVAAAFGLWSWRAMGQPARSDP